MQDRDLATMSLNDWMEMADWEWEHALEQVTAEMYLAQAKKRAAAHDKEEYYEAKSMYDEACVRYTDASREFSDLNNIGTKMASLLRAKKS